MKNEPLNLENLPDLSAWGLCPLYTLEQAALLFGGIDPAFTPDMNTAETSAHPEQYRRAYIALQAMLGGIALKTLQVHELYLYDFNGIHRANPDEDNFPITDICVRETTVESDKLFAWSEQKNIQPLRPIWRNSDEALKNPAAQKRAENKQAKIIAALAILYTKTDCQKPYEAAKTILIAWEKRADLGKSPDVNTLAKYIKQGIECFSN